MHKEAMDFVLSVKAKHPRFFSGVRVLEIGSYNINGSVRGLFTQTNYVGIDWRKGPGVDMAVFGHELAFADHTFDVVISTECLEHDRYAHATFVNALRMLRPGGAMLITAAGPERPPHEIDCGAGGHYQNIYMEFFKPYHTLFSDIVAKFSDDQRDIYFFGVKI